VIIWELSFLVLLCVLDAEKEAREVAILLWAPSVGLVLGAGGVGLFHMQVPKAYVGPRLNSIMS
jgi:sphingomyelin phosphodiesterase 2